MELKVDSKFKVSAECASLLLPPFPPPTPIWRYFCCTVPPHCFNFTLLSTQCNRELQIWEQSRGDRQHQALLGFGLWNCYLTCGSHPWSLVMLPVVDMQERRSCLPEQKRIPYSTSVSNPLNDKGHHCRLELDFCHNCCCHPSAVPSYYSKCFWNNQHFLQADIFLVKEIEGNLSAGNFPA